MQTNQSSPLEYIDGLPADQQQAITELRKVILNNLPEGFTETMTYGMIGYVVPLTTYPPGYHAGKDMPLGLMSIAAQKKHIALYHMAIYADPNLLGWFTEAYGRAGKGKPDIGKSCIRFKNTKQIPYALIGELASKLTPQQWISLYEGTVGK